jgi:hypothetical protein
LTYIGTELIVAMSATVHRQVHGAVAVSVDIDRPRHLVARAMRWTRALQARLMAEAAAAAAGKAKAGIDPKERLPDRAEMLSDPPEWLDDDPDWTTFRAARARKPEPDDCIEGKPDAEVVGQICADLAAAAMLLGASEAVRLVAAITDETRSPLGA